MVGTLSFHCGGRKFDPCSAKSLQSCPTLCDARDGSPPGSPVPGILQARTLECVAISFSNFTGLESYMWCSTTKKIQPSLPQNKKQVGRGHMMREVGARTQRVFKEQTGILRREGWDRGSAAM